MYTTPGINRTTKMLVFFILFVHLLFFLLEAILWMQPFVYNILIELLDTKTAVDYPTQAQVLKSLFINQGFYNLFLVVGGLFGLISLKKNRHSQGYALLLLFCFSAAGAGIVLAFSTKAYVLAFLQAVPAIITFARIYPHYKRTLE